MTKTRIVPIAAAMAALAMAGCSTNGAPEGTPSPSAPISLPPSTTATAAPTSQASSAPASPSAQASTPTATGSASQNTAGDDAAATAAAKAWYAELAKINQNPDKASQENLPKLAKAQALDYSRSSVATLQKGKMHMKGEPVWASVDVVKRSTAKNLSNVALDVCVDRSQVQVIDAKGNPVEVDFPDRTRTHIIVQKELNAASSRWMVTYVDANSPTPC